MLTVLPQLAAFFLFFGLSSSSSILHFPVHRRGGRLARHEPANLTELVGLLQSIESTYSRTFRNIEDNRLVRRWSPEHEETAMLEDIAAHGKWYANIEIGNPPQSLEADLDFLSPDFYTVLTTSGDGSRFNTFGSQSYISGNTFVHPFCRLSSDDFHLQGRPSPIHLGWPVCQPPRSSRHTLANSGTTLGLAPNPLSHRSSLSRIETPALVQQLFQKGVLSSSIWSITVLDASAGILSLGGTLAAEFEGAKIRTETELKYLGQDDIQEQIQREVDAHMAFAMPVGSSIRDHFKWIDVSNSNGWWTGLMSGVWVDGVKILRDQPFLLDLSCPFIIAPPTAFKHLYRSISGSQPLPQPPSLNSSATMSSNPNLDFNPVLPKQEREKTPFHLFPCLNPPSIALELSGWPFPLASPSRMTREDALHGPAGGPFSLGKFDERPTAANGSSHPVNTGFCVGVVVSSDMGEREGRRWRQSGLENLWVLGEPFFRGTGVVFDVDGRESADHDGGRAGGKMRVGFRKY